MFSVLRDNLVVVLGTFFWSIGLPIIDHLLGRWDFYSLATARAMIAGVFLFVLSFALTRTLPSRSLVFKASLIGLSTYGVSAACLVIGLGHSDPVTAAIIVTLIPVISAVMDVATRKRRVTWRLSAALGLSVTGGIVATLQPEQLTLVFGFGELALLTAMVAFVLYSRSVVRFLSDAPQLSVLSIATLSGALGLLVLTFIAHGLGEVRRVDFSTDSLLLLLFLGVFSMGISIRLWMYGAQKLGVTVAALHQNLTPVWVMLIMLVLGHGFSWQKVAGGVLVVTAAVIAQFQAVELSAS